MGATGRFCPICWMEGMILWLGGYTGTMYRCTKCGYVGPIVIERDIPPGEGRQASPKEEDDDEGEDEDDEDENDGEWGIESESKS